MGCISSKHVAKSAASPVYKHHRSKPTNTTSATVAAAAIVENGSVVTLDTSDHGKKGEDKLEDRSRDIKKSKKGSWKGSFRLEFSQRYVEAEQVAAGWPSWLSSAAGEAIHGWVPLRADSFEKLEKI